MTRNTVIGVAVIKNTNWCGSEKHCTCPYGDTMTTVVVTRDNMTGMAVIRNSGWQKPLTIFIK